MSTKSAGVRPNRLRAIDRCAPAGTAPERTSVPARSPCPPSLGAASRMPVAEAGPAVPRACRSRSWRSCSTRTGLTHPSGAYSPYRGCGTALDAGRPRRRRPPSGTRAGPPGRLPAVRRRDAGSRAGTDDQPSAPLMPRRPPSARVGLPDASVRSSLGSENIRSSCAVTTSSTAAVPGVGELLEHLGDEFLGHGGAAGDADRRRRRRATPAGSPRRSPRGGRHVAPCSSATSTRRTLFDEFADPTTITRSARGATFLIATWRFWVA